MTGVWWQYAAVFAAALLLAWLFTPLAIRLAFRSGALDQPGGHKAHGSPVPYLGGLAIVVAFSIAMAIPLIADSSGVANELLIVLACGIALAVIGLFDDLRGLSPWIRLAAEIAAAAALVALGLTVSFIDADWLSAVVVIVWVVGITNAFNLLDNMDGLSAGLAGIASFAFFAIAAANGQFLVAGMAIATAGCAFGFLRHNAHPARIYMGDAGALFLGFVIAYLGLKLNLSATPRTTSFLVPILVCSVAVLDTTLVSVTRIRHGRSPFTAGRDHLSHRLTRVGLSVPVTVAIIWGAGAAVGVVAFVVARIDTISGWLLTGLVAVAMTGAGVLLGAVPVYETSRGRLFRIGAVPPDDDVSDDDVRNDDARNDDVSDDDVRGGSQ
jgi:UDP-GlcNAc:undecaprenyl-phosphate GlcNAc-1-phosphate transferase